MHQGTDLKGYLAALVAFGFLTMADASAKAIGTGLPPYETAFFIGLAATLAFSTTRHRGERWRDFTRMKRPLLVHARALSGLVAVICGVYAFSTIRFAEATSLMFLAPVFVTIFSTVFLRERIGKWRWSAVFIGFAGVLLVVRPGFQHVHLGHASAIMAGMALGTTMIILRHISATEKRTSLLGTLMAYLLAVNGLLMLVAGAVVPSTAQLTIAAAGGLCMAAGQACLLLATRYATASQVSLMHYSELLWAVALGFILFGETLAFVPALGVLLIATAGVTTIVREHRRAG